MKKQNMKLQLKKIKIADLANITGGEIDTTTSAHCIPTQTTMSETQETELECNVNAHTNENNANSNQQQSNLGNCLQI